MKIKRAKALSKNGLRPVIHSLLAYVGAPLFARLKGLFL
jgi:hypothetical protein